MTCSTGKNEHQKLGRTIVAKRQKANAGYRPIYCVRAALPSAVPISIAPVAEVNNARAYRRAHEGKLMVQERSGVTEPSPRDFFHLEDVGTHPTGLLVTGIFEDQRRAHMMATAVRDASDAEIAAFRGAA